MDWPELSQQELVRIAARLAATLLTAGLLLWIFRRARQGAARSRDHSDVRILEYPAAIRWLFPIVGTGFGILYAVTTHINPAGIEDPVGKLFAPTLLIESLCLLGFLETWVVKIEVSGYGITSRSPWTGTRQVAWGQVEEVRFSERWQWFVVEDMSGTRIYLHVLLGGLRAFHTTLVERLESGRFAAANPYLLRLGALSPFA